MILLFTACHTTIIETDSYSNEKTSHTVKELPTYEKTYVSLGLGIYEFSDPDYIPCPEGATSVKFQRTLLDFLIHVSLGGIVTTRHVQVFCKVKNH